MASGRTGKRRVFTIPAGAPFLSALADALVAGRLGVELPLDDPLSLARSTIYLPTRRAVRAFRPLLGRRVTQATGRQAILLPRLIPLGDAEEAEVLLALAPQGDMPAPVIPELQRRLKLSRLVKVWATSVNRAMLNLPEGRALLPRSFAEAFALSSDLAAIIDEFGIHDVPFDRLGQIDLHHLDAYWTLTTRFLAIAGEAWPQELARVGCIEATQRDRLLVEGLVRSMEVSAGAPVIAAGSTGSLPTTARLLDAITRLPQGAVVLPDLDLDLDPDSLDAVQRHGNGSEAGHPQAILTHLVSVFGIDRADVVALGTEDIPEPLRLRRQLLTEAFRPVATTAEWAEIDRRLPPADRERAMEGVTIVQAPDERLEALAAAAALRRALEEPDRTAALVTPDRNLAERVVAELRRWDIEIDDTAGLPLHRTEAGRLAAGVLRLALPGFMAQDLVTLLSHPLARFGLSGEVARQAAATIEIGALRGAPPFASLADVLEAVRSVPQRIATEPKGPAPRRRLAADDIRQAGALMEALVAAMADMQAMPVRAPVTAWAKAHRSLLLAVGANDDGTSQLDGRADAALLFDLLADLEAAAADAPEGDLADYAGLFGELAAEKTLRVGHRQHPRLKVLGLLEARLVEADTIILGGLTDDVWPPLPRSDAFLNRALRLGLGLPSPERRIGQTAHDFVQAAMAPQVILTRPLKAGTAQSIPSRFLQRLAAVAGEAAWSCAIAAGDRLVAQVVALDRPESIQSCSRPQPKPPVERQPTRLSVTEIETLYRDPYAIYARHVLGLSRLEPIDEPLGHGERGSMLHEIVARFGEVYALLPPGERARTLAEIARTVFEPKMHEPEVALIWWPVWQRIAPDLLAWEERRRPEMAGLVTEAGSRWAFDLPDGASFTLTARADRIETQADGTCRLIDFKSGTIPKRNDILAGFAPQLTLQSVMAAEVGFGSLPPAAIAWAGYVQLKAEAPFEAKPAFSHDELQELAVAHLEGLKIALAAYRSGQRGYAPRIAPADSRRAGDFDRLARVAEWSRADGGEAEE